MAAQVRCQNKGCHKFFDPDLNEENSCQYHPGVPIFHDAKKKWSCCSKYSTDFSEFMSYPGCAFGKHDPTVPSPQISPQKPIENVHISDNTESNPSPIKAKEPEPFIRPSIDAEMIPLPFTVAPSLQAQLDKLDAADEGNANFIQNSGITSVDIGTSCKNSGCKCFYEGPQSNNEICTFHPGIPIFHEGMKFWSCCTKRTPDFDVFMQQKGCTTGSHTWIAPKKSVTGDSTCRIDWHQTGNNVCISVFAKQSIPKNSKISCNGVVLSVDISFEKATKQYTKTFNLLGVVDPAQSKVNFMGTKVEVSMRKSQLQHWPSLELKEVDGDNENEEN